MPKYKVKHPGLYLRVNNKLQKMEVGTEIELTESKAKSWASRGFIEGEIQKKTIKIGKKSKKD